MMPWWKSILAVAVGGMLGCLMRWGLALTLNRYFPIVPPGTLAANLIGCYVIGMALAVLAEVVMLLQAGRMAWAMGTIAIHVVGSLAMTFAGIATIGWARN